MTKTLLSISLLAGALFFFPTLPAQDSDQPGKRWQHNRQERLANLAPEERQRVIAAHQAAMQDPAVQAAREKMRHARKDLHSAMKAAMLKADPSIGAILDKIPKHEKPED